MAQPPGNDPQSGYGQPHSPYQQPPPAGGYGAYPGTQPPYPPPAQGTNTMAILALVFAFVFSPLGIVFGIMARKQIARTGEGGDGLALAGIILSSVFILLSIISIIAMVSVMSSMPIPS